MKISRRTPHHAAGGVVTWKDLPGIVIADGSAGRQGPAEGPRLRAFIYGEEEPAAPTLPFGRWKA